MAHTFLGTPEVNRFPNGRESGRASTRQGVGAVNLAPTPKVVFIMVIKYLAVITYSFCLGYALGCIGIPIAGALTIAIFWPN